MDNSFQDFLIFTVELPVFKHKHPDGLEAKLKEVMNPENYEIFKDIVDDGQETISSRWVITQKEKHDGQKTEYKVRLVARGFQKTIKLQSNSPSISKESCKLLMAIAANNDFKLASVDI